MGPPKVQATYMKQFAARVKQLGARGEAVVAGDPDLFERIEAASRLGWLPVELNVRMIDALILGLGPRRAHDFQEEQITSQLSTPLWSTFVEGGIRLLGLDPAVLSRWLPNAVGLIFRSCGTWTVERQSESHVTVHVRGLPPALTGSSRWIESVSGGFHALFVLCRTTGEAHVAEQDLETGTARIELHWKPVSD